MNANPSDIAARAADNNESHTLAEETLTCMLTTATGGETAISTPDAEICCMEGVETDGGAEP